MLCDDLEREIQEQSSDHFQNGMRTQRQSQKHNKNNIIKNGGSSKKINKNKTSM